MQDSSLVEAAQDVLESLAKWRATRRGGEAIPEELWVAAVGLAGLHGVFQTARHLRLDYGDLKRRVRRAQGEATGAGDSSENVQRAGSSTELAASSRPASAQATFIEWLPAAAPANIGSCAIQVESRRGASMRVDLHQVPADALAAIIRTFAE